MSPAAITSAHAALPQRRTRFLAAVLAVVVAGGGATLASSGLEDRSRPTDPGAWPAGPIEFNDPAVVKGARGGKKTTVTFPLYGGPTVRTGVGGQR
jgi:hypothetical protein